MMKSDQTVQCDVLTHCAHLYMLCECVFCSHFSDSVQLDVESQWRQCWPTALRVNANWYPADVDMHTGVRIALRTTTNDHNNAGPSLQWRQLLLARGAHRARHRHGTRIPGLSTTFSQPPTSLNSAHQKSGRARLSSYVPSRVNHACRIASAKLGAPKCGIPKCKAALGGCRRP